MGFAEDSALLEEFNEWVGAKKVASNDFSPSAFLIDRAKESAYDRLLKVQKYAEELRTLNPENEVDEFANMISNYLRELID